MNPRRRRTKKRRQRERRERASCALDAAVYEEPPFPFDDPNDDDGDADLWMITFDDPSASG